MCCYGRSPTNGIAITPYSLVYRFEVNTASPQTVQQTRQVKEVDLTGLINAKLWGEKSKGGQDEKIRQTFLAI